MPVWSLTEDESKIVQELHKESDRAAAIIAGALLEDRIEITLRARFTNHKATYQNLFGVARPLNSFAAKNDLAFLLRCYGKKLHTELEIINRIRNRFAHYLSDKGDEIKDFNSTAIKNLSSNLTIIESYIRPMSEWEEKYKHIPIMDRPRGMIFNDHRDSWLNNPRERFILSAGLFSCYLGIYPNPNDYIQLMSDEPISQLWPRHELC